jgi:hypothetical protein
VSGKYINSKQIQLYMDERDAGNRQITAAAKAGFSVRTAGRIDAKTHRPQQGKERDWRTRHDPLVEVWESELQPLLQREPRLEAMTLYEYLQEHYPGQYQTVLRTVQRRVSEWKAQHGNAPPVMFELRHSPGEMGFSDFTELSGVTITIGDKPFEHLLYHYRLGYSGWQYVQIIQGGESFVALSQGLQNALWASGGVPKIHRTDSLTAAFSNSGGKHKLTQRYEALCSHYQMRSSRNNTGIAHENGAIESSHGYFKRRLKQQLFLRGSFEFESISAYGEFITQVIAHLNGKCSQKFTEEQAHLQLLPKYRTADYDILSVRVSCRSSVDVKAVLYTVPERLIGRQLTVHLYHDRLVGFLGQQQVVELPRLSAPAGHHGRRPRVVNYRHIIAGLRQKPRALLYCAWQSEILPNDEYRQLWQQMLATFERDSAARVMVEALYIAATQDKEAAVAQYLQAQLATQTLSLSGLQRHFQLLQVPEPPEIAAVQHPLSNYDLLLHYDSSFSQSLRQSHSPSQAPQTQPYADPLAASGTTGDSRTLELCPISACPDGTGSSTPLSGTDSAGVERVSITASQIPQQLRVHPLPDAQPSGDQPTGARYQLAAPGGQRLDFWSLWGGQDPFILRPFPLCVGIGQAGQVFLRDGVGAIVAASQAEFDLARDAPQTRPLRSASD